MNHNQPPPTESTMDYTDALPECILGMIVSHLPTKDAARSTAISSRWRCLWDEVPLNLDDSSLDPASENRTRHTICTSPCKVKELIRTILYRNHHRPVHRCRLSHRCFESCDSFIDHLLRLVTKRGVKVLDLKLRDGGELPVSLLACKSVEELRLVSVRFPSTSSVSPSFTNLRELTLSNTTITKCTLEHVISCSESLEKLTLMEAPCRNKRALRALHIRSKSLRTVTVKKCLLREFFLVDVPNLKTLLLHRSLSWLTSIKIANAPKLEELGNLGTGFHELELGDNLLRDNFVLYGNPVCTVTTLTISVNFGALFETTSATQLLRCFPFLERLHIHSLGFGVYLDTSQDSLSEEPIDCLRYHLKLVVHNQYKGIPNEFSFANYLVQNAKVLRVLKLVPSTGKTSKYLDLHYQHFTENKASADAVIFVGKKTLCLDSKNVSVQQPETRLNFPGQLPECNNASESSVKRRLKAFSHRKK